MQTNFFETLNSSYGPVMDAKAICKVLHYPTVAALQAARARGKLRFKTVEIEGRRGVFAATADVARFLDDIWGPDSGSESASAGRHAATAG